MLMPVVREIYPPRRGIAWLSPAVPPGGADAREHAVGDAPPPVRSISDAARVLRTAPRAAG
jgi:hypothetical protein